MPRSAVRTPGLALDVPPARSRILCIYGSLRAGSYNRGLLEAARAPAPPGVELQLWGRVRALPPFSAEDEQEPGEAVLGSRKAIAAADAVLIATPQYNASLPGQLKDALDWASRPYEYQRAARQASRRHRRQPEPLWRRPRQAEARVVLSAIGADVLEGGLALARAVAQFDSDGSLATPVHRVALTKIVEQLVVRARDRELVAAA